MHGTPRSLTDDAVRGAARCSVARLSRARFSRHTAEAIGGRWILSLIVLLVSPMCCAAASLCVFDGGFAAVCSLPAAAPHRPQPRTLITAQTANASAQQSKHSDRHTQR